MFLTATQANLAAAVDLGLLAAGSRVDVLQRPAKNGNYYSTLGLYWENGEANGNYYSVLGLYYDSGNYGIWGHYPPIMENQMEKKMENEMESGIVG